MPLLSKFTWESRSAATEETLVHPDDFVFKTSYTDHGPEVIAFKCRANDTCSDLYIVEGVEAQPEDKPLVRTMLDSNTFVTRLDQPHEEPEELGYFIVSQEQIVGWFTVRHLTMSAISR